MPLAGNARGFRDIQAVSLRRFTKALTFLNMAIANDYP
jgi:hypothetical protein